MRISSGRGLRDLCGARAHRRGTTRVGCRRRPVRGDPVVSGLDDARSGDARRPGVRAQDRLHRARRAARSLAAGVARGPRRPGVADRCARSSARDVRGARTDRSVGDVVAVGPDRRVLGKTDGAGDRGAPRRRGARGRSADARRRRSRARRHRRGAHDHARRRLVGGAGRLDRAARGDRERRASLDRHAGVDGDRGRRGRGHRRRNDRRRSIRRAALAVGTSPRRSRRHAAAKRTRGSCARG